MKLSIIIPVYNAEKYLEKCMKSIFDNIENSFEVILINDGSKDNSLKIIKELMKKYKNIELIDNSNNGVSYSRNLGIKKAKGNYIMFVDADDELKKNWFDKINRYMTENYDIVYFSKYNLDSNKNDLLKYIIGYNKENICIAGPYSKIFRKEFIEKNNILFNDKIINGEDMLFNIEALSKAKKIQSINEPIYLYRRYVGQTTKKFDIRIFDSDVLFHEKITNLLNDYDILEDDKEKIKKFCLQGAIIMLYERISYIEKYSDAKKYICRLYSFPYNKAETLCLMVSKSNKIKYALYKIKPKCLLYHLFRFIRRNKFKKNSEEYILI